MKKLMIAAVSFLALSGGTLGAANAAPYQHDQHGAYTVNGHHYDRQRGPAWSAPRDYHGQRFQRGQRLPSDYRRAEIHDWRAYHLRPPPRGYHYVRVGNDVVLAAITTGIVSAVIANAFYQ